MKIYHLCMFFALVFISGILVTAVKVKEDYFMKENNSACDAVFDRAVDAAAEQLRGYSENEDEVVRINSVNAFFDSLYSSFNAVDSPLGRMNIRLSVPFIAITVGNGFYVYYWDVGSSEEPVLCCTEKKSFMYCEHYAENGKRATDFIIRFNGRDDAVVCDIRGITGKAGRIMTYKGKSLMKEYGLERKNYSSLTENKEKMEEKRCTVMSEALVEQMDYYCNRHNETARHFGINYGFSLPEKDNEIYLRAFDGISFLAFFQGYPVRGSDKVYNCFTVTNAMVLEKNNDEV